LVLKAGRWYLVAGVDGAPRTYRVNQISALTVLPDGFDRPEGFDLEAHWHGHVAEFRDRLYTGEALVRLSPATVPRLPHLMGSAVGRAAAAGVTQPDGWMLARVPIESHAHAAGEFLRLGAGVEVLEPAALRDLLARTVADLTALYGRPPPAGTTGAAGQESPPPPAGAAG
jgi:predicted DNA-binding transcriptional regulator YafY